MKELVKLIGHSPAKIRLKMNLLGSSTDEEFIISICKMKRLWDETTLRNIYDKISLKHIPPDCELMYENIKKYLLPYGGVIVNDILASLSIDTASIKLLPYLKISNSIKLHIINVYSKTYPEVFPHDVIDEFVKSNVIIPRPILRYIAKLDPVVNYNFTDRIRSEVVAGKRLSIWDMRIYEYLQNILRFSHYEDTELDTLFLSVLNATNCTSYEPPVYSMLKYWECGGSLFPTNHYSILNDGAIVSKYLRNVDSFKLDKSVHEFIDINESAFCGGHTISKNTIIELMFYHQVMNMTIYDDVPPQYRITSLADLERTMDNFDLKNYPVLRNIKYSKFTSIFNLSDEYENVTIRKFFELGGLYRNIDNDKIMDLIGLDLVRIRGNFDNIQDYIWGRHSFGPEVDDAIKKTKATDLIEDLPNMYGICGSDEVLIRLSLKQFTSLFPTKDTYLNVVHSNGKLLKYYKPVYMSIVDYNNILFHNPQSIYYMDLNIFHISKIVTMIDAGILKLNHPFFESADNILAVTNAGANILSHPENLYYFYKTNPILFQVYIEKLIA